MKTLTITLLKYIPLKSVLIDIAALTFIYSLPALSHLLSLPVYLIEPMRMMLIIAMVHSSRANAYILALTMPLFSFLISSHPSFYKMLLISFELVLNVSVFYLIVDRVKHVFAAIFTGIVISKLVYYALKFGFIGFALIGGSLVSTPLLIQLITALIYSTYLAVFFEREMKT
ncbi:MAG: hypothetical protein Q8S18_00585 [Bacteroidales bacterium]|nr:hypothetical protein [Bacteroidales bacterium]